MSDLRTRPEKQQKDREKDKAAHNFAAQDRHLSLQRYTRILFCDLNVLLGEKDCSYESPWPAELAEHVEEVHQRRLTEAEEQGSPYPISVRKQNIRKELEKLHIMI